MNRTADQREAKKHHDAPVIDAEVEKLRVIEQFVATLACAEPYGGQLEGKGQVTKAFAAAHEPMLRAVWTTMQPLFARIDVIWGDDPVKRNRTYTARWLWSAKGEAD